MDAAVPGAATRARQEPATLVTIYTSSDCHWCAKAKQYLAQRGVPYVEKNVEDDPAAGAEAIQLSGQRGTPVIVAGAGVVAGFNRRALDALLGLGALDAVAEAALPPAQDTLAATAAAGRVAWTPAQQATAHQFAQRVDTPALCAALGRQLDYSPANCDHTFRHLRAFLTAQPLPASDVDSLLALTPLAGRQVRLWLRFQLLHAVGHQRSNGTIEAGDQGAAR